MADYQDNLVDNNATLTTSANGAALTRPLGVFDQVRKVVMFVNVANAPTGTSPNLSMQLQSSLDGTNWANVGSALAFTAAGTQRLEAQGVEPFWRIAKTVTGTTPSFTGVTSHVMFSVYA
jgi:hypothetical protein